MAASSFPEVWVVEDLRQQKLPARRIVSTLRRAGVSAQLVDLNQGAADLVATAQREQPRLILASILFADRVDDHLALLTGARATGIQTHLALTGHLPALMPKTFLDACPALDFVFCGEGERIATDLAECLKGTRAWGTVSGVVGRQAPATASRPGASSSEVSAWDDGLHHASDLSGLQDLTGLKQHPQRIRYNRDSPAFPSYDTIPHFRSHGFATVQASRGCYHACTFCLPRAYYARCGVAYRSRRMASLMDEIESLYQRGVRLFLFDDEQFLPPGRTRRARVEALADELARRNLRIAFTIKCRADDVEPGLYQLLKEIGLIRVYVGIESGCQATLDLLGKQTTVQQNVDALVILDELGIVADWRALVFHPWSTLEMLEAESAFLHCISAHLVTVIDWREIEVFAGTALAERMSLEGRSDASAWLTPYSIPDPRAELVRRMSRLVFCSEAYRQLCDAITEAWFAVLLRGRLQPGSGQREEEAGLKAVVTRANEESLKVWGEMLSFAEAGNVYNAGEVNARASEWVERVTFAAHAAIAGVEPYHVASGMTNLLFP